MQRLDHPLLSPSLGTQRQISSFHFGTPGTGTKVYIQASLHAEELPGMLAIYHLQPLLEAAEAAGQLRGEVVLVPCANPIGLSQRLDHKPMGRFEFDTSENFNRQYPDLAAAVIDSVAPALGADAQANVQVVRRAMGDWLNAWQPSTELQSQRKVLLTLAHDADVVLDLHCDCEGVMHFYCEETCWPQLEPIARLIGSRAVLLARQSGGEPFDECLSGVWWRLADALRARGIQAALPQGCCSTTIELRGELDVHHDTARQDARALMRYLQHLDVVHCTQPVELPAPLCAPTPLAGSETLRARSAGVVAFVASPGQMLRKGELVAEVIDPISRQVERVCAGVDGLLYARINNRYVTAGCELAKVAGSQAFRSGSLLGD